MQLSSRKKRAREATYTVSFRVSARHLEMLEKGAQGYSVSVHEHARQLLIAVLEDQERDRIKYEIAELKEEVNKHRDEFANAIGALMAAITEEPKKTAEERKEVFERRRKWVSDNLRQ